MFDLKRDVYISYSVVHTLCVLFICCRFLDIVLPKSQILKPMVSCFTSNNEILSSITIFIKKQIDFILDTNLFYLFILCVCVCIVGDIIKVALREYYLSSVIVSVALCLSCLPNITTFLFLYCEYM